MPRRAADRGVEIRRITQAEAVHDAGHLFDAAVRPEAAKGTKMFLYEPGRHVGAHQLMFSWDFNRQ